MINDAITPISTINLAFKDTSILCNVDGGLSQTERRDCFADLRMVGVGGGGGGPAAPLTDACQLTSGCKNKLGLWRQMKRPAPPPQGREGGESEEKWRGERKENLWKEEQQPAERENSS